MASFGFGNVIRAVAPHAKKIKKMHQTALAGRRVKQTGPPAKPAPTPMPKPPIQGGYKSSGKSAYGTRKPKGVGLAKKAAVSKGIKKGKQIMAAQKSARLNRKPPRM